MDFNGSMFRFGGGPAKSRDTAYDKYLDVLREFNQSGGRGRDLSTAFRALEKVSRMDVSHAHINRNVDEWLGDLRLTCRDMIVNNPFGRRFVNEMLKGVVGDRGINPDIYPVFDVDAGKGKDNMDLQKCFDFKLALERSWQRRKGAYNHAQGLLARERDCLYSLIQNGEYFVVYTLDANAPFGYRWEVVEPWRCPLGLSLPTNNDGMTVRMGKVYDENHNLVSFLFLKKSMVDLYLDYMDTRYGAQPGLGSTQMEFEQIPAERVCHVFNRISSEQERGFPEFSAAIAGLVQEQDYVEIAHLAAAQAARLTFAIVNKNGPPSGIRTNQMHQRHPDVASQDGSNGNGKGDGAGDGSAGGEGDGSAAGPGGEPDMTTTPMSAPVPQADDDGVHRGRFDKRVGAVILAKGDELMPVTTPPVNTVYPHFVKDGRMRFAAGSGMTPEMLTGDFSGNYMNTRAAQISDWGNYRLIQMTLVEGHLEMDLKWLAMSQFSAGGRLAVFSDERERWYESISSDVFWQGRGQVFVDAVKQANAMATVWENKHGSLADILRGCSDLGAGLSPEELLRKLCYDEELQRRFGVKVGAPPKETRKMGGGKNPIMGSGERDTKDKNPPRGERR